ncbi:MAG: hypothetical protein M3019_10035 [Candidatus Dormibacteraeota bacterium]|nr:hypothetical protein [Candidatus Dormibacteraeota bacterium]
MLVAAVLMMVLAGCGDTTSQPAWVHAHPDTSELAFQTTAPGVCAITVQYPNDAPAVIGYLGSTYVQVQRRPHPSSTTGRDLGHSGDWRVLLQSSGDVLLVTPGDAFDYRLEASC